MYVCHIYQLILCHCEFRGQMSQTLYETKKEIISWSLTFNHFRSSAKKCLTLIINKIFCVVYSGDAIWTQIRAVFCGMGHLGGKMARDMEKSRPNAPRMLHPKFIMSTALSISSQTTSFYIKMIVYHTYVITHCAATLST